jgi:DNA-binding GntR family transcriptional regulator
MTSDAPDRIDADLRRRPDSLRHRIYADLRSRLQRCTVAPDERLIDLDVARAYGTSRMPAREALLQLVHEGYLVGTTRGFMVPRLSRDDVRDIFEVRRLLEPRAAALAARDLSPGQERELRRALDAARTALDADDAEGLIVANIAFRGAWLSAVRNRRLAATIARFVDQVQTVRLETLRDPTVRRAVVEGLEGIFDAFARRDAVAAADRITAFIVTAEQSFFARQRAGSAPAETTRKAADV